MATLRGFLDQHSNLHHSEYAKGCLLASRFGWPFYFSSSARHHSCLFSNSDFFVKRARTACSFQSQLSWQSIPLCLFLWSKLVQFVVRTSLSHYCYWDALVDGHSRHLGAWMQHLWSKVPVLLAWRQAFDYVIECLMMLEYLARSPSSAPLCSSWTAFVAWGSASQCAASANLSWTCEGGDQYYFQQQHQYYP